MNAERHPRSALAPVIERYVAYKHALGRHFGTTSYQLARLDRFLALQQPSDLTPETFSTWCASLGHLTAQGRRQRMRVVYHLCLYRRRTEPHCFVPDPSQFPPAQPRCTPCIFTEAQITRLLDVTQSLSPHPSSPLHRQVARLAVVLLYTTGMRRGEVVRLALGDYDAAERLLTVRDTKFHKSRLVPVSADVAREIEHYLNDRLGIGLPRRADSPLLLNGHGGFTGYTGPGFGALIRKLFREARLHTATGRVPRVHDLRFTFAVHALLRWYRAGIDVQARLPSLSTYMGHASVASTQYYLSLIDVIAQAASDKYDQHCSKFLLAQLPTGGTP